MIGDRSGIDYVTPYISFAEGPSVGDCAVLTSEFVFHRGLSIVFCDACFTGCGGGGGWTNPGTPNEGGATASADFTISVASGDTLSISEGSSQSVAVQIAAIGNFTGTVQVTTSGLPNGVTAGTLSIPISGGNATGNLQLTASSNATTGVVTVNLQATSGTLSHNIGLTLTVTTNPSARAFITVGGAAIRGFYDTQRQLLFTTNILLNEVDVIHASDLTLQQRISIPQPVGIDQMADGNTLVIGTRTQGIYTVDESTYAVTRYLVPEVDPTISVTAPLIPVSMSNGKVLFVVQSLNLAFTYVFEGSLYEWNPVSNTLTSVTLPGGSSLVEQSLAVRITSTQLSARPIRLRFIQQIPIPMSATTIRVTAEKSLPIQMVHNSQNP